MATDFDKQIFYCLTGFSSCSFGIDEHKLHLQKGELFQLQVLTQ
jgi:hypothetical protein